MLARARWFSLPKGPIPVAALAILLATPILPAYVIGQGRQAAVATPSPWPARANLAGAPLLFEPNAGQTDPGVSFTASSSSGRLFFTPREVALYLRSSTEWSGPQSVTDTHITPVRLAFLGANPAPTLEQGSRTQARVNYMLGNDPSRWRTNLPTYDSITYRSLYPGIDLTYQGTASTLKGTYSVAPHADPSVIRWRYSGAEATGIDASGDLQISTENRKQKSEVRSDFCFLTSDFFNHNSKLVEEAPVAWQDIEGRRVAVRVGYRLLPEGEVGLSVGAYDPARPLVIDPTLVYSESIGGSVNDLNRAIAVDAQGNAIIAGVTASPDYPLVAPFQDTLHGFNDGYITKLSADGSTVLYSTYLGGSSSDVIYGIALDGGGNIYVAGMTASTDFPTRNPIQPQNAGGGDAFVAKLNSSGSDLVYSTYLGGPQTEGITEHATSIAVDGAGNAYVAGVTASLSFPTRNAIQPAFGGGQSDFFVTKINAAGSDYVYSTYLGGGGTFINFEEAEWIAADGAGNAYVVGTVSTDDFPVHNAIQPEYGGGESDAVVVKLNPTGSFVYSTYLGGNDFLGDQGHAITADSSGNAYVTGEASCQDFPVHNAFQPTLNGNYDPFVTVLNSAGSAYIYSTYFGGSMVDFSDGIGVFGDTVYFGGHTESSNFPIFNPLPPDPNGNSRVYIARLPLDGSPPLFSTLLPRTPGHDMAEVHGLAVDHAGNAYVSGYDFVGLDAQTFIVKVAPAAGGTPVPTRSPTGTATQTPTPIQPTATPTTQVPAASATQITTSTSTAVATATAIATATASSTPTACSVQFSDVPSGDQFYAFIRCLACHGIISGYSGGTFRPGNDITRGQIAKVVSNAAGIGDDPGPQVFADVDSSNPFYVWINRLANRGFMSGYRCGGPGEPCGGAGMPYFRPFANATRAQLAKIASNVDGIGGTPTGRFYADVPEDHPFHIWIMRLTGLGVISGYDCGGPGEPCDGQRRPYFRPYNNVTRGQASKIVANTFYPDCRVVARR
jgi:hypothetical protein